MKKVISALLLCAPLSTLAADNKIDLKFSGNLIAPTCKASLVGTTGNDIPFGDIAASDLLALGQGTVVPKAPVKDLSLKFAGCDSITNIKVNFVGGSTSGAGFIRKAVNFLDKVDGKESGLGVAFFTVKNSTSANDAIYVSKDKEGEPNVLSLATLTKSGSDYLWPLYAKMVVARGELVATSSALDANSAGKDLIATISANIVYL